MKSRLVNVRLNLEVQFRVARLFKTRFRIIDDAVVPGLPSIEDLVDRHHVFKVA